MPSTPVIVDGRVNPAANPGEILGERYQVGKMIGRGAMADVFEGLDRRDGRHVALKVMRTAVARDPEPVQRFAHEAHVQEMIEHRNVARLYDAGMCESGSPYLVMELLRGRSLLTVLRKEGRVSVVRAASYAWQALQGLSATHAVGVLHRDLKPANLMLEPSGGPIERVVLIDFGFAALGTATGLTLKGHVVGSLSYISPERLRGGKPDARADLYGIGIILYELLIGRCPFVADDDLALIKMHIDAVPVPPSVAAPDQDIPPALDRAILRALAKRPTERADSAAAMAAEIEAAVQGAG
jgi:serine/threonine-protein kinase